LRSVHEKRDTIRRSQDPFRNRRSQIREAPPEEAPREVHRE
jgi:hypothetical protein